MEVLNPPSNRGGYPWFYEIIVSSFRALALPGLQPLPPGAPGCSAAALQVTVSGSPGQVKVALQRREGPDDPRCFSHLKMFGTGKLIYINVSQSTISMSYIKCYI